MDKVKIGSFIKEVSEKTTTNNQYILLTSSQSGIVSQQEYFNKQVASKDNTGYKIIKRGQFTYRAMSDTGCFYINRLSNYDVGIVSPAYPVFEITEKKTISGEFLQLFFESNLFQSIIANKSTGSTRLSLKLNKIKDIDISIPSLDEQKKIVSTIGFISDIISWRKKQIEQLDILLKSRFIEMFGDPYYNPKGWHQATLNKVCYYIKDGPHKSLQDLGEGNGHPFISVRNIINGKIDFSTAKYISDSDYDEAIRKCHPEKGDILYSKGGTTGIAKLIDIDVEFANWVHVAVLKFDKNKINGVFFENMLNSDYCYTQSQRLTKGIANRDLVLSAMAKIELFVPPIDLQNKFADFVAQVDKSKFTVQKSLNELEILKKSLMQQYFG